MTDKTLTQRDVMQILDIVQSAPDVAELRLRCGDFEIELSKYGRNGQNLAPKSMASVDASAAAAPATIPAVQPLALASPPETRHRSAAPVAAAAGSTDWEVLSPMVGTCYEAPEPGAKPFVAVGDRVEPNTPLCIVEVMKLMNTVTSSRAGVVKSIHFSDRQAVEYGQLLVVVTPD